MNKKELKQLIKPIVKECINEVLLQEGVLSSIISEVMVGTQAAVLQEQPKRNPPAPQKPKQNINEQIAARRQQANQSKQKLLDAIGGSSYNGVNLFEGTEALNKGGNPSGESNPQGALAGYAAEDSGVDISGLMNLAGGSWKKI
tara:strand:- start:478 stop:909 length:432 start_codon:yes stop_codon:yes gene_type:complete